jgi:ethanolamine ammonia-lyase large subunit
LANTRIKDLYAHPLFEDNLQKLLWLTTDQAQHAKVKDRTLGELKEFLLTKSEDEIKGIMFGLTSDTIGCVPKLMSNEELTKVGQTVFNPLPGTKVQSILFPRQIQHPGLPLISLELQFDSCYVNK